MMLVKTTELEGAALDYAVAVAQGWALDPHRPVDDGQMVIDGKISLLQWLRFSTDWHHGGPLIESYKIGLLEPRALEDYWTAWAGGSGGEMLDGQTPLVAACRAVVAAKLGDAVEVPKELAAVRGGGP